MGLVTRGNEKVWSDEQPVSPPVMSQVLGFSGGGGVDPAQVGQAPPSGPSLRQRLCLLSGVGPETLDLSTSGGVILLEDRKSC